jgi:hypothetical protein
MKKLLRKLGSVKVWIALWSMMLINYIVVMDRVGFVNLAILALTPIICYLGANVWQKKVCQDKKEKENGDAK